MTTYVLWLSKKGFFSFGHFNSLLFMKHMYCIVSYFVCISFVSGLESKGLSKLFIVNTKDLLKSILHFLNVLIISTNFWVLYRTINIRHICSIYHSLIHSTTPQNRWRHLCADRPHSDHPHITVDPNLTLLCSTSSLPFQSHLLLAWPVTCYKKKGKEKKPEFDMLI